MKTTYLSCAETAKLIRAALKKAFPATKFGVRSKTYSGGASISVSWTDGPTDREVSAITGGFAGAGFDGMIDLKYHVDHWLMPDGCVSIAHTEGTAGSMGTIAPIREWMPHPDAKLVSFGADYVFTSREISPEYEAKCARAWDKLDGFAQCRLLNHGEFPRWPEDRPGRRLASFMSAC